MNASDIAKVKRLDGEIINNYFKSSFRDLLKPISRNKIVIGLLFYLIEFRLFVKEKYPYSKTLNGFELTKSKDHFGDCIENWPLKFQKLWRISKFLLRLNFLAGSDYLSLTDHLSKNVTQVNPLAMNNSDQIFASRQELFSLIYEVTNVALSFNFLKRTGKINESEFKSIVSYQPVNASFVLQSDHPSCNFMTTHPILSYPINSGLKEFQFFNYNGKIYYIYGYKSRIIILDQDYKTLQTIQTTLKSDITCLSLRECDGTIAVSSMNIVSIYRLNDYKFKWDFALNLTLGFNVAYLCFGIKKYLAVVGSQLTIWEEIDLKNEDDKEQTEYNQSSAWFNVYSNIMPRPFKYVKFSPCETMFATTEVNAFPLIKIWHIQDRTFVSANESVRSKIVRFSYIPKKMDISDHFFWIECHKKSILCTAHDNYFYFWDFDCTLSSIKMTILLELAFKTKMSVFEYGSNASRLYFLNERDENIQIMNIKDLRFDFVDFNDITENILNPKNSSLKGFSGYNRIIIPSESESILNIIGLCNRNVSSVEFDKISNEFLIKKTWPFFSDKIKILYETDTDVFFLNSDKRLCVTNSRNQVMIRVLSSEVFDQAVMFSQSTSISIFLIVECKKLLKILEVSKNQVLNIWEIGNQPIVSDIFIRGKYFITKTSGNSLILKFTDSGKLPYEIFQIKSDCLDIEVLNRDQADEYDRLKLIKYEISDSEVQISLFSSTDYYPQATLSLIDASLAKSKIEFGKFTCISVGSKVIKATRYDIANNSYSLQNICRNIYGDPIQVKYFEDSRGVSYFLSLHQRYFLIFVIETSRSGILEASLVKSISIPENEFTENCLEIALTGSDKIYLRDDSNAYEITLETDADGINLSEHCIPLKASFLEFILIFFSRQDISRSNLVPLLDNFAFEENYNDIEPAISIINDFKSSVDVYALRAIFSASLRHKVESTKFPSDLMNEMMDYELASCSKSDSQNILIEAFTQICQGQIAFSEFKSFKFSLWVKNIDHLKVLLEKVARNEFMKDSDNLDLLTFIYILMGKVKAASIIWNRSRNAESQKVQSFLSLDFSKEENRIKAEKNAFALIGKQRFELALAFFLLANRIEDARQLAKKLSAEFRSLIDRFYILDDEFMISKNLNMKIINGVPELLFVEKKGLSALFEIQKSQHVESCKEHVYSYVKFLLKHGATFLALFIMKNIKIFNVDATNIAILNAIAINSKILNIETSAIRSQLALLYEDSLFTVRSKFRHQFELIEETNASSEQNTFW